MATGPVLVDRLLTNLHICLPLFVGKQSRVESHPTHPVYPASFQTSTGHSQLTFSMCLVRIWDEIFRGIFTAERWAVHSVLQTRPPHEQSSAYVAGTVVASTGAGAFASPEELRGMAEAIGSTVGIARRWRSCR